MAPQAPSQQASSSCRADTLVAAFDFGFAIDLLSCVLHFSSLSARSGDFEDAGDLENAGNLEDTGDLKNAGATVEERRFSAA